MVGGSCHALFEDGNKGLVRVNLGYGNRRELFAICSGAPLIVAEDGTSQTMNWLMSSSVGCESMLIGVWAPEEVRPEKTEVV